MKLDAAAVRLDTLSWMLQKGMQSEAIAVARSLYLAFQREAADVEAAEAVSYLYQAVRETRATPELVSQVKGQIAPTAEAPAGSDRPDASAGQKPN